MPAPGRFIAWCKQEQASLEQQLEMMESGKVRTGEDIGSGWIDMTEQSIGRAKARLAELNELLLPQPLLVLVQFHPCRGSCCFGPLDSRSGGGQFLVGQMDQIHKTDCISKITSVGFFRHDKESPASTI